MNLVGTSVGTMTRRSHAASQMSAMAAVRSSRICSLVFMLLPRRSQLCFAQNGPPKELINCVTFRARRRPRINGQEYGLYRGAAEHYFGDRLLKTFLRGAGEGWQQLDQTTRGAFGCVPQCASRLNVSGMDESRFVASRSASMSAPISR